MPDTDSAETGKPDLADSDSVGHLSFLELRFWISTSKAQQFLSITHADLQGKSDFGNSDIGPFIHTAFGNIAAFGNSVRSDFDCRLLLYILVVPTFSSCSSLSSINLCNYLCVASNLPHHR